MMKPIQLYLLPWILIFVESIACKTDRPIAPLTVPIINQLAPNPMNENTAGRLSIRVGSSTFTATLLANPTVNAFKARLPLTLSMNDLNGNEKFTDLPSGLPINASNPGTIHTGDLMVYGSGTLVLFYESFRTSYSYTKLGQIENPAGLAAALGSGSVKITFALVQ